MLGPLLIFALFSTDMSSDRFSISRDLLPFGVPAEFADGRSAILAPEELRACIIRYAAVEKERLQLSIKRLALAVDESHGVVNKQRQTSAPKDSLDMQLDEIEKSVAEQNDLTRNTREFLRLRANFFAEYLAFADDCGSKTYRSSDVRTLFPNGVPD